MTEIIAEIFPPRGAFGPSETRIATLGEVTISAFRYGSGIEALRLTGPRSEIVLLPFFGHQIWRARFDGQDVTMASMFDEPVPTTKYLETYGAFFIHCGLLGLGDPGPTDKHPLHGELPLAPFADPVVRLYADGSVEVEGTYHHRMAFTANYRAVSRIRAYPDAAHIDVSLRVQNLRAAPMDLLYLGHANFRPVDGGRLDYSVPYTTDRVAVRRSVPSHISPPPGYSDFIEALANDPTLHHRLDLDKSFDPEVVFMMHMAADPDGWAHAMQTHPDGGADFISYDTATLPLATRWICRTADQQGLGIAMPATSGVEGYTVEKAAGHTTTLDGNGTWVSKMRMGRLDRVGADELRDRIDRIAGRA